MNKTFSLYLSARFFRIMTALILCFSVSFFIPLLFLPAVYMLIALGLVLLSDILKLYARKNMVSATRSLNKRFSLSDPNRVQIDLKNNSRHAWKYEAIDEIPVQFQKRDFIVRGTVPAGGHTGFSYELRPLSRGNYAFGDLNVFLMSRLGLAQRRVIIPLAQEVQVYPSVEQMRSFELYTLSQLSNAHGIKKMRRTGHSYEFEQIKPYVRGDDVRQINWRSTARSGELMINQFEDERSQSVYSVIDKSRSMLMPFGGMSLLDYAINTSLAISRVALLKQDKAGLMTFSDKMGAVIRADRRHGQLQTIQEALYAQKERALEANFEQLYLGVRNLVRTRSLLFLYTNFESMYALKRALPVLRKISRQHLLVLVFFRNTELEELSRQSSAELREVYTQILAEQSVSDKAAMALELRQLGIQTILSTPEELTLHSINKYLEMKSRGMI